MIAQILTLLVASPAPPLTALEPPIPASEALSEGYDELLVEYTKAALNWRRSQRAARKARETFDERHPIDGYYERFLALSDGGDGEALQWIALNVEDTARDADAVREVKRAAIARLTTEFVREPYMLQLAKAATKQRSWFSHTEIADILEAVFSGSEDDEIRVNAAYKLARHLEQGPEDGAALAAERWYETIIAKFPSAKLAGRAKNRLQSMNIAVGKIAPDFDAEDVDGNAFKLSDYRGKVVVLDFWGFW